MQSRNSLVDDNVIEENRVGEYRCSYSHLRYKLLRPVPCVITSVTYADGDIELICSGEELEAIEEALRALSTM